MVNFEYKKPLILLFFAAILVFSIFFIYFQIENKKQQNLPIIALPSDFIKDKTINIVFTVDKEYKEYLKVALNSMILNKDKKSYYNIYILCVDLLQKDLDKYKEIEKDGVRINTVKLTKKMLKGRIKEDCNKTYTSRADYFKFFIPEMFKNFDKILYLDSDTLILGDLSSLYNMDIKDKYIGAIKKYDFKGTKEKDFFINCGVLLYNNKKWQETNFIKKIVKIKNNETDDLYLTENAFNVALKSENIEFLSPVYNNIASAKNDDFKKYDFKKNYAPFLNEIDNLEELDNKTIIVHFAGYKKPWRKTGKNIRFAKQWRGYAKASNVKLNTKENKAKNTNFLKP